MKSKKLFLPAIILVVAVLAITVCSVFVSIAKKPTVTEHDFPFSITYELDGERVTINDVYRVRYVGNDGYADTKSRIYVGEIGEMEEGGTVYTLKKDGNTRVELWTQFYPDYLMGDCDECDYFDEEPFEPRIYYYDSEEQEWSDEETLSSIGVKLIDFEYPEPVENTFVFSHLSYFSSEVVLPILFIALIALLAVIIFVKKDQGIEYKAVDVVSIVFNCVVGSGFIWLVTIFALFININGGGPELYYQLVYFIPAFTLLCIAASIALRRKGHRVKSLVTGLIGPAVFTVYLIVVSVIEL